MMSHGTFFTSKCVSEMRINTRQKPILIKYEVKRDLLNSFK